MKKLMKIISLSFIVLSFTGNTITHAQVPYKHSIGVTVGTFYGPTYKTFLMEKMALQVDLGIKLRPRSHWGYYFGRNLQFNLDQRGPIIVVTWDLELNPNLVYQSNISKSQFAWFAGGGVNLGYAFAETYKSYSNYFNAGKFGVNATSGIEYVFSSVPISLQLDFRPGYGLIFYTQVIDPLHIWSAEILEMTEEDYRMKVREHYFDWTIGLSVRYTF